MTMQIKDGNGDLKHLKVSGIGTSGDPFVPIQSGQEIAVEPILQFLDSVGDGTGTTNLNGNYATATTFKIAPAAGEVFVLHRLIGYLQMTGSFDAGSYANGLTLVNGIKIEFDFNGGVIDMMGGIPVMSNGDWAGRCYDASHNAYGAGDEYLAFRWSMDKYSQGVILDGDLNQEMRIILEDNFSTMAKHTFLLQGHHE